MTRFLERFEAAFEKLNSIIAACVAASIGAFVVLASLDLFLRKLRWGSLEWLHEGAEYGLYVGVFLSASWVLSKGAHVRVDIVLAALPPRAAIGLERAMDLAGALLCALMSYLGAKGTTTAFVFGSLPDKDLRIPNWYMLLVFSVSFALLTIEFLLRYRRAGTKSAAPDSGIGL